MMICFISESGGPADEPQAPPKSGIFHRKGMPQAIRLLHFPSGNLSEILSHNVKDLLADTAPAKGEHCCCQRLSRFDPVTVLTAALIAPGCGGDGNRTRFARIDNPLPFQPAPPPGLDDSLLSTGMRESNPLLRIGSPASSPMDQSPFSLLGGILRGKLLHWI